MGDILVATAARPHNIHLDRRPGGCQQERNINCQAGVGLVLSNELKGLEEVPQKIEPSGVVWSAFSTNGANCIKMFPFSL
jgi:hypothetical protein